MASVTRLAREQRCRNESIVKIRIVSSECDGTPAYNFVALIHHNRGTAWGLYHVPYSRKVLRSRSQFHQGLSSSWITVATRVSSAPFWRHRNQNRARNRFVSCVHLCFRRACAFQRRMLQVDEKEPFGAWIDITNLSQTRLLIYNRALYFIGHF